MDDHAASFADLHVLTAEPPAVGWRVPYLRRYIYVDTMSCKGNTGRASAKYPLK
jgi:hypothetical protein